MKKIKKLPNGLKLIKMQQPKKKEEYKINYNKK